MGCRAILGKSTDLTIIRTSFSCFYQSTERANYNDSTSIQAVNPEIAALSQHQDPASTGAAASNKQIALNLAVQIAAVGGDPNDAIKSGTFAPGTIGDPTAAGNTCDDQNDPTGCIFTKNLLVPDVTADEIAAAVGAAGGSAGAATAVNTATAATAANTVAAGATDCPLPVTVTMTVTVNGGGMAMGQATTISAAAVATSAVAAVAAGSADNLQTFTGALGQYLTHRHCQLLMPLQAVLRQMRLHSRATTLDRSSSTAIPL